MPADLEKLSIDTIRCLAMDAVQKANAGHPGTAMALAPVAYVLYRERMRHDPADPHWPNRDRFVLSAGHACILQYAALHLTGYDLAMDDLKQFRQWGSRTPGHPELDREHPTPGVEITTGPLGQGVGNAVGMALAEAMLAVRYNSDGSPLVDHRTYAICSDGDVMEGVSGEASSIAGFLGLAKLCLIYDDNHITIEGSTGLAFGEDVGLRYEAYGFHVQRLDDGWTTDDLRAALDAAEAETARPSLIIVRTHIAIGAPHAQDTPEAHGAPLGEEEVRLTKQAYGWDPDKHFYVPDGVYAHMDQRERGAAVRAAWNAVHDSAPKDTVEGFDRVLSGKLPEGWEDALPDFTGAPAQATRQSSGACINALAAVIPELVGGSADLAPSTTTTIKGAEAVPGAPLSNKENAQADSVLPGRLGGRTFHFGIREHGMGAILNGFTVHGGFRAFGATFFVFSDYMRPSVRLASIMRLPVIYVWTHDSIGLGEDGPTHQPIEHLASLRAMPFMHVIRPADATETAEAWRLALERNDGDGPVGLALSRQKLPVFDRSVLAPASGVRKGGYVLADASGTPDVILIGSGSEVHDLLAARETLSAEGVGARVVSLPDWDLFMAQPRSYREEVLPPEVWRRVSLEAGATFGWSALVGERGTSIGLDRFGASAPAPVIAQHLGITPERVVTAARGLMQG
ncbi:MAG TPA: transketolase [Gaiellales bacterium]|nr:transketolase [Gaiellales bacterium]